MDHPDGMSGGDPVGDGGQQLDGHPHLQPAGRQTIRQGAAGAELHRQVRPGDVQPEVVHLHHLRVPHRRHGLGLGEEPLHPDPARGEQQLEGARPS